ncbi:phosphate ABC transporter, permease protein [Vibrio parahaemolyticus]|nr:phosphate ABC transporter, permease protein [Vibrio parahaemolyticus]
MPLAISVDDYSQLAFVLTQSGEIQYLSMDAPDKPAIYTQQLATNPVSFSQSAPGLGWYGLVDDQGLAHIFKPEFNATLRENTRPPEVVVVDGYEFDAYRCARSCDSICLQCINANSNYCFGRLAAGKSKRVGKRSLR